MSIVKAAEGWQNHQNPWARAAYFAVKRGKEEEEEGRPDAEGWYKKRTPKPASVWMAKSPGLVHVLPRELGEDTLVYEYANMLNLPIIHIQRLCAAVGGEETTVLEKMQRAHALWSEYRNNPTDYNMASLPALFVALRKEGNEVTYEGVLLLEAPDWPRRWKTTHPFIAYVKEYMSYYYPDASGSGMAENAFTLAAVKWFNAAAKTDTYDYRPDTDLFKELLGNWVEPTHTKDTWTTNPQWFPWKTREEFIARLLTKMLDRLRPPSADDCTNLKVRFLDRKYNDFYIPSWEHKITILCADKLPAGQPMITTLVEMACEKTALVGLCMRCCFIRTIVTAADSHLVPLLQGQGFQPDPSGSFLRTDNLASPERMKVMRQAQTLKERLREEQKMEEEKENEEALTEERKRPRKGVPKRRPIGLRTAPTPASLKTLIEEVRACQIRVRGERTYENEPVPLARPPGLREYREWKAVASGAQALVFRAVAPDGKHVAIRMWPTIENRDEQNWAWVPGDKGALLIKAEYGSSPSREKVRKEMDNMRRAIAQERNRQLFPRMLLHLPDDLLSGYDSEEAARRGGSPGRTVRVDWFVMDWLDGVLLERVTKICAGGKLSPEEALVVVEDGIDICNALHRAGIVHNDFNNGKNILLTANGLMALDFGLSYRLQTDPTRQYDDYTEMAEQLYKLVTREKSDWTDPDPLPFEGDESPTAKKVRQLLEEMKNTPSAVVETRLASLFSRIL